LYLTFAWRYFKVKKNANAINIIAWVTVTVIAFATACQILVLSVFNGFEDLVKSLYGSFYSDIKIIPTAGKTFLLTNTQLKKIQQLQGIQATTLVAEEKAMLQNGDAQSIIHLKGVDKNYATVSGVPNKTYQGKFDIGTIDAPGLIVGAGIQNAASITVEGAMQPSTVNLILPKKTTITASDPAKALSEGNAIATGVFSIQQEFDNKYAITNIEFVQQQMGFEADEYSAMEIKATPNYLPQKIQIALKNLLGKNYVVQTKYQQNASLYSTMQLEKWVIYAVLTLILFIAAFNMISALTMLVLEKQKDINVLQSIGATTNMILKIFLSEGILLGLVGAAIGLFLATSIGLLQLKYKIIKLQGGSFLIDYFPVKFKLQDFCLVTFTVLFIAFLAAWFPAKKASKQPLNLR
jgi:lipoprotein-releasing system permease protein